MIYVWTAQLGQLRRIATVETTLSLVFQVPDEMFGRKWSSVFREKKKLAQEDMIMLLLLLLRLSDWLILFGRLISGLFGSFHNLSSVSLLIYSSIYSIELIAWLTDWSSIVYRLLLVDLYQHCSVIPYFYHFLIHFYFEELQMGQPHHVPLAASWKHLRCLVHDHDKVDTKTGVPA